MTVQYIDRSNTIPPYVVYNVIDFDNLLLREDVIYHAEFNTITVYV